MSTQQILDELNAAVVAVDEARAVAAAERAVAEGIDPLAAIEQGLQPGIEIIGDKFENLECFLPELMGAATAFRSAVAVLEPEIVKKGIQQARVGVVVLGTVKGDIHKIGKDILALLLKTRGFDVHDLGEDVAASAFMQAAVKHEADIIGLSALLNTTMPEQQEVIDLLNETGVRDKFAVMVGGAPVTQAWADEIGADAYAETAQQGVTAALATVAQRNG